MITPLFIFLLYAFIGLGADPYASPKCNLNPALTDVPPVSLLPNQWIGIPKSNIFYGFGGKNEFDATDVMYTNWFQCSSSEVRRYIIKPQPGLTSNYYTEKMFFFTPPVTRTYTFSIFADFTRDGPDDGSRGYSATLFVMNCASGTQIFCTSLGTPDAPYSTSIGISLNANVNYTYTIVESSQGSALSFSHLVRIDSEPDDCSFPLQVFEGTRQNSIETWRGSSTDPAPCDVTPFAKTGWFSYIPPTDQMVTVSLNGSTFDTSLGIWTGPCKNLVNVTCNLDESIFNDFSLVTFPAKQGITYLMEVVPAAGYAQSQSTIALTMTVSVDGQTCFNQLMWYNWIALYWQLLGFEGTLQPAFLFTSSTPQAWMMPPSFSTYDYDFPELYMSVLVRGNDDVQLQIFVSPDNGITWQSTPTVLVSQDTDEWMPIVIFLGVTGTNVRVNVTATTDSGFGVFFVKDLCVRDAPKTPPPCPTLTSPLQLENVDNFATLSWVGTVDVQSYSISLGTDGEGYLIPSSIFKSVSKMSGVNVHLEPNTTYYLQIVPTSYRGVSGQDCQIMSFKTAPAFSPPLCLNQANFFPAQTSAPLIPFTQLTGNLDFFSGYAYYGQYYPQPTNMRSVTFQVEFNMSLSLYYRTLVEEPMLQIFLENSSWSQVIASVGGNTGFNWTRLDVDLPMGAFNLRIAGVPGSSLVLNAMCVRSKAVPDCITPIYVPNSISWEQALIASRQHVTSVKVVMTSDTTQQVNIVPFTMTSTLSVGALGNVTYQFIPSNDAGSSQNCPSFNLNIPGIRENFDANPVGWIAPKFTFFSGRGISGLGMSIPKQKVITSPRYHSPMGNSVFFAFFYMPISNVNSVMNVTVAKLDNSKNQTFSVFGSMGWQYGVLEFSGFQDFSVSFSGNTGTWVIDDLMVSPKVPTADCGQPTQVNVATAYVLGTAVSTGTMSTGLSWYLGTDGRGSVTPVNMVNGQPILPANLSTTPLTTYYVEVRGVLNGTESPKCPIYSYTSPASLMAPICQDFASQINFPPSGWTIPGRVPLTYDAAGKQYVLSSFQAITILSPVYNISGLSNPVLFLDLVTSGTTIVNITSVMPPVSLTVTDGYSVSLVDYASDHFSFSIQFNGTLGRVCIMENKQLASLPCASPMTVPMSIVSGLYSFQWNIVPGATGYYVSYGNNYVYAGYTTTPQFQMTTALSPGRAFTITVIPTGPSGNATSCASWTYVVDSFKTISQVQVGSVIPSGWSTTGWSVVSSTLAAPPGLKNADTFSTGGYLSAPISGNAGIMTNSFDFSSYTNVSVMMYCLNNLPGNRSLTVDIFDGNSWNYGVANLCGISGPLWMQQSISVSQYLNANVKFNIYPVGISPSVLSTIYVSGLLVTGSQGVPRCPRYTGPTGNNLTLSQNFTWQPQGGGPTSYTFILNGNDGSRVNMSTSNLSQSVNLAAGTIFNLTIVPKNNFGSPSCPSYSFGTMPVFSVPTIPSETVSSLTNFDDGTLGSWGNDAADSGEDFVMATGSTWGPGGYTSHGKRQSSHGNILYVDDSYPHVTPTNLLTSAISQVEMSSLHLEMDYYMNAASVNGSIPGSAIFVDFYSSTNGWTLGVANLVGNSAWNSAKINLTSYLSNSGYFMLKIRAIETPDYRSDIAIDNLNLISTWKSLSTSTSTPTSSDGQNLVSQNSHGNGSDNLGLIIGCAVGGFVILAIIIFVIIFLVIRRKKSQRPESGAFDLQLEPVNRQRDEYTSLAGRSSWSQKSSQALLQDHSVQWEISFDELELGKEVGRGAFGEVYQGKWRGSVVAIKVLTKRLNEKEIEEFRSETTIMKTLRPHRNLIQLIGVCSNPSKPFCIITEFMSKGSLDSFMRKKLLSHSDTSGILNICIGIATGMMHLHLENIIHRDLAARNCLLTENMEVKIGDFGLSRMTTESEGQTKADVGPLKWMSPEAVLEKVYSIKSDVWSFGVVMYEIITHGVPYESLDAVQAASRVALAGLQLEISGTDLAKNPDLYPRLDEIRKMCMAREAADRPKFDQILRFLEDLKPIDFKSSGKSQVTNQVATQHYNKSPTSASNYNTVTEVKQDNPVYSNAQEPGEYSRPVQSHYLSMQE